MSSVEVGNYATLMSLHIPRNGEGGCCQFMRTVYDSDISMMQDPGVFPCRENS